MTKPAGDQLLVGVHTGGSTEQLNRHDDGDDDDDAHLSLAVRSTGWGRVVELRTVVSGWQRLLLGSRSLSKLSFL